MKFLQTATVHIIWFN